MLLLDTNIFFELLRGQARKDDCAALLARTDVDFFISDLSLHSIGILLHRHGLLHSFAGFVEQILPGITVLHLPLHDYAAIHGSVLSFGLDFEDAYQYHVAQAYQLEIVTMDRDFSRVAQHIQVHLL